MEPPAPPAGHAGKENLAVGSQPSPRCRASPAASPARSDDSGASRKRGSLAQPPAGARPLSSPLPDPPAKRRRPGGSPSASPPSADEQETSAEAAARRQLAALASPSGRPAAQQQQQPIPAPAPPPPAPPLPDWWIDRPLQPLKREAGDADRVRCQDPFSLLPGHPLLALACEGQAALLAKVLGNGGEADARDARGLTALHLASRHARLACVKVLLEAGACVQVPDKQGRTPLDLAREAGHSDVLDMVQQHESVQAELERQQQEQRQQLASSGSSSEGGGGAAGDEGTAA